MIHSITVTNYLGESLEIDLARPEKSGFAITSIDGLGPANATINTTGGANSDGVTINSTKVNERNIVLNIKFQETETESIEDIRQKSYKYFPVKKELTFRIITDNRDCYIFGATETNKPSIFSDKSGCQISILCPFPYFYSVESLETIFYGIESAFEFPFENNSLTEDMIEIGIIQNKMENFIVYEGDAEVGITIVLHAVGNATNVSIYNIKTRESMKIDTDKLITMTGSALVAGDEITITSGKNNKTVYLLRDGEYTNILNCITRDSKWFALSKGDNVFAYVAETGSANLQFKIFNNILYEGV